MSNFKGTKGKWILTDNFNNLESDKGKSIASFWWNNKTYHSTMVDNEEEGKANALLMSKAPDMLELLENMYDEYSMNERITGSLRDFMIRSRKLIKEATKL